MYALPGRSMPAPGGLVVLTDDGTLRARIADPRPNCAKAYRVQVAGLLTDVALQQPVAGIDLGDFVARPCRVRRIADPRDILARNPAIRHCATIPTSWLELALQEGKNRQVKRGTARVGFRTLRVIRQTVGERL